MKEGGYRAGSFTAVRIKKTAPVCLINEAKSFLDLQLCAYSERTGHCNNSSDTSQHTSEPTIPAQIRVVLKWRPNVALVINANTPQTTSTSKLTEPYTLLAYKLRLTLNPSYSS